MESATTKKAFLIYNDSFDIVSELSDEQAGKLFKALFEYSINGTELSTEDSLLKVSFKMMKGSLRRDSEKYVKTLNSRNKKAKIGGIINALKNGNRLSDESVRFFSETNIGKEYLRRQGISEEVIESLWDAISDIEQDEPCKKINCHKVVTQIIELRK